MASMVSSFPLPCGIVVPLFVLALLSFAVTPCRGQIQPVTVGENEYPELSSTCVAVLNQEVTCDEILAVAARRPLSGMPHFYDDDELEALCTQACTRGLDNWMRRIRGACQGARVDLPGGTQVVVDTWAELYLETYDSVCLRATSGEGSSGAEDEDESSSGDGGEFCNRVVGRALGVDPVNQQATASPDPSVGCNPCMLSLLQTQLAMPMASNSLVAKTFASLTESCSVTGFTMPPEPATTLISSNSSPTSPTTPSSEPAACEGAEYSVSSGEDCVAVATSQRISSNRLAMANNLAGYCYDFPTSGSLCIPEEWQCDPYTVQQDDTCSSIAADTGRTWADITGWNPELGRACNGISRWVGYVICVSTPGGGWVNPMPNASISTQEDMPIEVPTDLAEIFGNEDEDFEWIPHDQMTPGGAQAVIGAPTGTGDEEAAAPSMVVAWAPGTRQDCALYTTGPIVTDVIQGTSSSACEDVAAQYGIPVEDLVAWNPSLEESCVLREDANYCVMRFDDVPEDTTEACIRYAVTNPGESCSSFRARLGLFKAEFVAWNPSVGADCETFALGKTYCVEVLHFRQPGIIEICDKFINPTVVDWALEPCSIIEAEYGLSHARFVAWNPAVLDNCTGLYLGYDYCVSIPIYRPTYSTGSTAMPMETA